MKFLKSKVGKVILVVLGLIVVVVLCLMLFVLIMLGKMDIEKYVKSQTYNGQDMIDDTLDEIDENKDVKVKNLDAFDALIEEDELSGDELLNYNQFTSLIKKWYYNGEAVSSKKVINILLIGMDNTDVAVDSRADSMMIMSINKETEQITFASILRDQLAYVTDGTNERFEKMHHANVRGGPELQIATFEGHYKIQIDNYVLVNFTTFSDIIDDLGGVDITLTEAEAEYMGMDEAGLQTLSGEEALAYARIRYLDSDVGRVNRQQNVMISLFNKIKSSGLAKALDAANQILPSVRTGLTETKIINMVTNAFTKGWIDYEIVQTVAPSTESRMGGMLGSVWYWTVDYPLAAHDLQMDLYGKSNIPLANDRVSWLDIFDE